MKKKTEQESVFKEAWGNMSRDIDKLMPEKLRKRGAKKSFFLLFAILELLVIGVVGKLLYDWLIG